MERMAARCCDSGRFSLRWRGELGSLGWMVWLGTLEEPQHLSQLRVVAWTDSLQSPPEVEIRLLGSSAYQCTASQCLSLRIQILKMQAKEAEEVKGEGRETKGFQLQQLQQLQLQKAEKLREKLRELQQPEYHLPEVMRT